MWHLLKNLLFYITLVYLTYGLKAASVLAFGTEVRVFKPGRSRRIFQDEKNPQHASLRKGRKAVCPMSPIYGM